MTESVYVHVGPHKTGTSFLQSVLARNKGTLAQNGVLLPGKGYHAQRLAVLQLLHTKGRQGARKGSGFPRWDRLTRRISLSPHPVAIISVEGLAGAQPDRIERLVESLAPADVHVIYGVRDLTRVIPGAWQTRIRNGNSEPLREFLDDLRTMQPERFSTRFWDGQDPRRSLATWERFVPRERITVVTVPQSGAPRDLLWQRFSQIVGLDPAAYSLDTEVTNVSIGASETEVLRRLNATMHVDSETYKHEVRRAVLHNSLRLRPDQKPPRLPASDVAWVAEIAGEIRDFLATGPYRVVGDLDELVPATPKPSADAESGGIDIEEALDASVEVIASLLSASLSSRPAPAGPPPKRKSRRRKKS